MKIKKQVRAYIRKIHGKRQLVHKHRQRYLHRASISNPVVRIYTADAAKRGWYNAGKGSDGSYIFVKNTGDDGYNISRREMKRRLNDSAAEESFDNKLLNLELRTAGASRKNRFGNEFVVDTDKYNNVVHRHEMNRLGIPILRKAKRR